MLELMAGTLCLEYSALGAEAEVEVGQQPPDLQDQAEQGNSQAELGELVLGHRMQLMLQVLHLYQEVVAEVELML
jgi:hypothetical protein